ncbi:MAG: alpha-1,4-glucan--maltose-1-phosphate maltosyltransferase [Solirubrobacteraceae bacterium]
MTMPGTETAPERATADSTPPPPRRIVIQYPAPAVDGGRYPAKRCVGDVVRVSADVFRDGHDLIRAVVAYRPAHPIHPSEGGWREAELEPVDADRGGVRWAGAFEVDRPGRWEFTIRAWTDTFGTWRDELARKAAAGQHDLGGELSEGEQHLAGAAARADRDEDRETIAAVRARLADRTLAEEERIAAALDDRLAAVMLRLQERRDEVGIKRALTVQVDRVLARFGAWYELFPRSWGGLSGVREQLPRLAELGFDVVYLPPIHPIGHTNRKGRNNSLSAAAGDPGSPWAIGDETGGHDAVHPDLGTTDDLRALASAAREHGLEIALDFAIQCSADHPWLTQHPEWFHHRPDGTLKYAENPPKRYQDIYNVNWDSPDWRGLWDALVDVVLHWVDCGVRVFRVDNPHTKPFAFWAWLIDRVHARDRDVIFLAEAFTKRSVMRHLAKLGFSQSYTYFTWKNTRWALTEYLTELAESEERDYFRPNFFANTPDILHEYLQHGGPAAFEARLVLAATLSPSYGIYSGFEHYERVPVRDGSEEYLHSEKYELRERSLDGPLLPLIARLNEIRRASPALQHLSNITFLETANEALIAYAKRTGSQTIVCVVNLDPHHAQQGLVTVPAELGLAPSFAVVDLLTNERWQWRIGPNYVGLTPGDRQAHVLEVTR